MSADHESPAMNSGFSVQRLSEALADVIRVAESRGQRLGQRRLG
jgi:hypothetical protein